jgi:hypothetical protein
MDKYRTKKIDPQSNAGKYFIFLKSFLQIIHIYRVEGWLKGLIEMEFLLIKFIDLVLISPA